MAAGGSIQDFSDVLMLSATMLALILKTYMFVYNLSTLKVMLVELKDLVEFSAFGREGKKSRLEAHAAVFIRITKYFYGSAYLATTLALTMTFINHQSKILPYETWFIWNYKEIEGLFWAMSIYQFAMANYCSTINFSFDLIPVIFMSFIATLLKELSIELSLIGEERETNGVADSEKLRKCIDCHIRIKKLAKEVSENLSFPFIAQTILSTVILCTSAFLLTTVRTI